VTREERALHMEVRERLFRVLSFVTHGRYGAYLTDWGKPLVERAISEDRDVLDLLHEAVKEHANRCKAAKEVVDAR
jgi:hypothetical protein